MGSINYGNNKLFNLGLNYDELEKVIEKDFENEDLENEEIRYIIDNETLMNMDLRRIEVEE